MTSISIITPSYNQGRYIERTILSVLSQPVADMEYVVVDGASKDETVDILKKYEDRLRWVSEKDSGQPEAVNKGLRMTDGEIIGWVNSDDVYYPDALPQVVAYFDAHPEVDVLYGKANIIDENDCEVEPYPTEPWNFERFKNDCYISQPAAFLRRRMVERFGYLVHEYHYTLDYEYWLRLALGGAVFQYLPVVLAGARIYPETKTISGKLSLHYEMNGMMIRKFGRVPDRWLFNFGHAYLYQHNMPRSHRFRFAVAVSAVSLWAALRWNKRISRDMLATTYHWIAGNARATLKEKLQR